ncbi:hypothetical protein T310_10215 [Rasamsonia emersonii CBS 393.64]|uniref:Uncharacterized protein n=2 Tax=Eurotiales TaxID=5042 RepID=A0A0F4YDM2_RASE3|nr:hypothetical protein T310_10215 [Rasamsonia emersonii CBS 393.64]KKA16200.1 hypothetical protein T310_10215 [Rasamsonia emersonii CBS 393.64]
MNFFSLFCFSLFAWFLIMHRRSQFDQDVTSDEQSHASAELPDIFSNSPPSDGSSDSETEPDSDESDDDDDNDDDDSLFDNEEQHPPEYYLAEAECLDVSQLRQQRYSPKTRKKLEDTGVMLQPS